MTHYVDICVLELGELEAERSRYESAMSFEDGGWMLYIVVDLKLLKEREGMKFVGLVSGGGLCFGVAAGVWFEWVGVILDV